MADDSIEQPSAPQEDQCPNAEPTGGGPAPAEIQTAAAPVVSDGLEGANHSNRLPFPVVGIGASAGGIEAYIELFDHLPASTGMAFVLISHLSGDQKSYLPEIVARHTTMPTVWITTGL